VIQALLEMAVLVAAGVAFRRLSPGVADAAAMRAALSQVVYDILLPALVFRVLVRSPLGGESLVISATAASAVLLALGTTLLLARRLPPAALGAVALASAWPNATYLGLPVLEAVLGARGRGIAIQYDLFACLPLLLTVGLALASRLGQGGPPQPVWRRLAGVPALWAVAAAVAVQAAGLQVPALAQAVLDRLAPAVVPLMLLVLGMGLEFRRPGARRWRWVGWVLACQLFLMPAWVWGITALLPPGPELRTGLVLEAAMPSMVLGVVICDRFRLDTGLYAAAAALSTVAALITLPLWHGVL